MLIGTHYVSENEPCFLYTELDDLPPKGKLHRYRNIFVIRSDRIAKYIEDMGLSSKQKHDPCRILGGVIDPDTKRIFIEHTVAELRAIAAQLKARPTFDKHELAGVNRIRGDRN